jgi:CheY-like chemotaxis protein
MKKRILIVDDDAQFRLMLRRLLEREGYEVFEAGDGKEGIKAYRNLRTEVVVTDIIMPEMEGVETIMKLRKEFPGVKIFAISGGGRNSPDSYLSMAEKLGARFIMEKPLDRPSFLEKLAALIAEGQ